MVNPRLVYLSLVDKKTSIPFIGASVWTSLNETRYSPNHLGKCLYSIGKFYSHVENRTGSASSLDRFIIEANTPEISKHLRTFLASLQNSSSQKNVNSSKTLQQAVAFIIQTTQEMSSRKGSNAGNIENVTRELHNLKVLYKFLKPNKNVRKSQIRSV